MSEAREESSAESPPQEFPLSEEILSTHTPVVYRVEHSGESPGDEQTTEFEPSSLGERAIALPQLWTLWDLGLFLGFALVTMVFVGGAVFGAFNLLNHALGWGLSLDDSSVQTPIAVIVQTVWELLWVLFIYQIVVVKYRQNFWNVLRWTPTVRPAASYVFAGFALSITVQLVSQLFPKRPEMPIEKLFDTPSSAYLLAFFGICVAPFMEELVFRGFFYPTLERRWGAVAAVLATGTLFAAIHAPQLGGGGPELMAMLAVGLILSTVRAATGSLKPSFFIHLGYNSSLFILLFISTNRFQTL